MSRENVEVVRAAFAAWNAGDMQALRELYDPDAVMYHLEGWPEPGPSVGREAVMRQWEGQRKNVDIDALEPISDFIEAGGRVVVRYRWSGTGHGPDMRMEFTGVHTVRKGKVLVTEWFWDHAEALEAVGLSE
jgi:ketosteroid isomerase-like protein